VFYGIRETCNVAEDMKALGLPPGLAGKRVVIQGLGNVGYLRLGSFPGGGALLVGLAESEGAIANPKGLDIEQVMAYRRENRTMGSTFRGDQPGRREENALELDATSSSPPPWSDRSPRRTLLGSSQMVVEAGEWTHPTPEADRSWGSAHHG